MAKFWKRKILAIHVKLIEFLLTWLNPPWPSFRSDRRMIKIEYLEFFFFFFFFAGRKTTTNIEPWKL
jgi:hypothetical protein